MNAVGPFFSPKYVSIYSKTTMVSVTLARIMLETTYIRDHCLGTVSA